MLHFNTQLASRLGPWMSAVGSLLLAQGTQESFVEEFANYTETAEPRRLRESWGLMGRLTVS